MRVKNRSRTEIVSQILETAIGYQEGKGVTNTELIYKVFISSAQLKEYVILLTEHDLLRYDQVVRKFKTTEKGLKFLELYNKLVQVMAEEKEEEPQIV